MMMLTRRQLFAAAGATLLPRPEPSIRTISKQPDLYSGWPTLARTKAERLLLVYSGGREAHVCPFGRVEMMQSDIDKGQASTSMIQRAFRIGYNRAARIIDTMESEGLVGPIDGAKPRQVLVDTHESEPDEAP